MLESDILPGQVNSDKVLTKTEEKATMCPFVSSDLECTPALCLRAFTYFYKAQSVYLREHLVFQTAEGGFVLCCFTLLCSLCALR